MFVDLSRDYWSVPMGPGPPLPPPVTLSPGRMLLHPSRLNSFPTTVPDPLRSCFGSHPSCPLSVLSKRFLAWSFRRWLNRFRCYPLRARYVPIRSILWKVYRTMTTFPFTLQSRTLKSCRGGDALVTFVVLFAGLLTSDEHPPPRPHHATDRNRDRACQPLPVALY